MLVRFGASLARFAADFASTRNIILIGSKRFRFDSETIGVLLGTFPVRFGSDRFRCGSFRTGSVRFDSEPILDGFDWDLISIRFGICFALV